MRRIEIAGSTIRASPMPASRQGSTAALNMGSVVIRRNCRIRARREQPSAHASRQRDGRGNGCFDFFHKFLVFAYVCLTAPCPSKRALDMIQAQASTGVNAMDKIRSWFSLKFARTCPRYGTTQHVAALKAVSCHRSGHRSPLSSGFKTSFAVNPCVPAAVDFPVPHHSPPCPRVAG